MSVPSNLNKHVYNGNDVTTSWSFTFPVILSTDIEVILTDTDGLDGSALAANLYTVDTAAGTVTYPLTGSPLPTGWKITLLRVEPLTQLTTLTTQGAFSAANIERALDKLTMITQQHDEALSRTIAYPVSQTPSSTDTTEFLSTVLGYKTASAASAAAAAVSATSAGTSATAAANYAAALAGTSTTSNSVATGAKTFTTQANKQWAAGQFVIVVDAASTANYMVGQVTSYSGTTLIIDSQAIGGSGTKTSWNIYVSGTKGASGAAGATTTRGTFTNASLSAGVLTITHNGALASPYVLNVYIYNNSGVMVFADQVNTFATNSCNVDLTSYGTLTGTWSYSYVL